MPLVCCPCAFFGGRREQKKRCVDQPSFLVQVKLEVKKRLQDSPNGKYGVFMTAIASLMQHLALSEGYIKCCSRCIHVFLFLSFRNPGPETQVYLQREYFIADHKKVWLNISL
jgi:hypothetical protein